MRGEWGGVALITRVSGREQRSYCKIQRGSFFYCFYFSLIFSLVFLCFLFSSNISWLICNCNQQNLSHVEGSEIHVLFYFLL